MNILDELALKYGTDKWGKHHYTPVYYDLFKDKRNEVKKVLEIGTAEGRGLFMFRDFFSNAMIYGAEIDENRVKLMEKQDRIKVIKCDQSKEDDLSALIEQAGSDIDIVIDDGSHKPDEQLFTCGYMMPFLKKSVIYIIEDIDETNGNYVFEELLENYDVQMVRVGKRYDDRLIIIKNL